MAPTIRQPRSRSRLALLVLLLAALLSASSRIVAHADVAVPSTIRAALFINTGASASTSLTSVATLQSAGGLKLVWRDPQFSLAIGSTVPNQLVRFGMDGYRALVLETADLSAATAVLKSIQAQSSSAFMTQLFKSGKMVYQVSEGSYATASQAAASLAKWTNAASSLGVQTLLSPRVAGPWAIEAGSYASSAEAAAAAEVIGNSGLDAFVALKPVNGIITYTVRVGQEKDAAALAAVQQTVIATGVVNVAIPAPSEPYAVVRNDMTLNGTAAVPVPMYAIPASSGVVLRADPAGANPIQLAERSKRSYRGSMELSVNNNSLAVINEVNLEHYLYSVVGTEVGSGWPLEAQKAQAVAARSYALAGGMAFKIAHVVDTTVSQAYYGTGAENPNSTAGVDATQGEVLVGAGGKIISALFSSNAGGVTADAAEGWGKADPIYASAALSPDDGPNAGKKQWYRISSNTGLVGYVREDLLADAGRKNAAGLPELQVTGDVAIVRSKPATDGDDLGRLTLGERVVPLAKVPEMTKAYSWVAGPFTPEQLQASLSKRDPSIAGPIYTLEVSARGPSGRATELKANGARVAIDQPDSFRSALGNINSTLFEIEETGRMTVLDGQGNTRELAKQSGTLSIAGGNGQAQTVSDGNLFIMDGNAQVRAATVKPKFIISGYGWGHGIGMSQWGARGFAEQGYDYQYILLYYYKNVTIEKGAK
ncbi:SpoIID/LytB domain-containing protein [Cohnella panacarvi]|uniref:SpoIID/LytB domain-containing protein n=1 Tax=Cohnella panacarvi TaxID=400776 RepID=UPI00047DCA7F|nr:SpoIID/LytB domain-containing protein [Cohnella panacarvi]